MRQTLLKLAAVCSVAVLAPAVCEAQSVSVTVNSSVDWLNCVGGVGYSIDGRQQARHPRGTTRTYPAYSRIRYQMGGTRNAPLGYDSQVLASGSYRFTRSGRYGLKLVQNSTTRPARDRLFDGARTSITYNDSPRPTPSATSTSRTPPALRPYDVPPAFRPYQPGIDRSGQRRGSNSTAYPGGTSWRAWPYNSSGRPTYGYPNGYPRYGSNNGAPIYYPAPPK